MSSSVPIQIIGMVWYKSEHYDAIRRVMADREKLPATFHEWRMKAETNEKKFRREGKIVVRAFINPETFPDWCRSRGLNIDAQARNLFAAEAAKDKVMSAHAEGGGLH
ncbi:MAG TPA: hypothetical protein PKE37_16215 [Thiomonas arsenitoxydans]|uniref:hypothetical protein n=1 Tax=Thiomonas arsenitoxydans (strain DSM 22701 / CIP 110005 / 3As) TaxID=426114 RepID=UPI002BB4BBE2|nr:hypothetical protein [Thiomonas arsenitoxydans]HML83299.1 hypothetical protein [Thiomonas arsenitoxydans]